MDEPEPADDQEPEEPTKLERRVDATVELKARARRSSAQGVWFGLGMMGLIGWSVVVPTLAGAALGSWLDRAYPGAHSWALTLLIAGLMIGCWSAGQWVAREHDAIRTEQEVDDE